MPKPYPEEFREDVVRVARNRGPGVTIEQVAADFGVHAMTLWKWMRRADIDAGTEPPQNTTPSNTSHPAGIPIGPHPGRLHQHIPPDPTHNLLNGPAARKHNFHVPTAGAADQAARSSTRRQVATSPHPTHTKQQPHSRPDPGAEAPARPDEPPWPQPRTRHP
ncbi:transposase [Streptomyces sp. NPDC058231]|uniref:transposase n=1 Tax=Streptomyces sp. NPDC058231 TaxID=3346392 RepID=UPI0036E19DCD